MYPVVKTTLDFVFGLVLCMALCWLVFLVWIVLYLDHRKPFFKQMRVGLHNKAFELLKFRSLLPGTEKPTRVGLIIRKLSVDELPQLINILKGDMSFVGPRPLLPEYLELYSDEQRRRHDVKPGLTGWAQIKGRNTLTWTEQFELDVWYVDNRTLWLDVKIIIWTILKLGHPTKGETKMRKAFNGQN